MSPAIALVVDGGWRAKTGTPNFLKYMTPEVGDGSFQCSLTIVDSVYQKLAAAPSNGQEQQAQAQSNGH